jgi:hypothetical protein
MYAADWWCTWLGAQGIHSKCWYIELEPARMLPDSNFEDTDYNFGFVAVDIVRIALKPDLGKCYNVAQPEY